MKALVVVLISMVSAVCFGGNKERYGCALLEYRPLSVDSFSILYLRVTQPTSMTEKGKVIVEKKIYKKAAAGGSVLTSVKELLNEDANIQPIAIPQGDSKEVKPNSTEIIIDGSKTLKLFFYLNSRKVLALSQDAPNELVTTIDAYMEVLRDENQEPKVKYVSEQSMVCILGDQGVSMGNPAF